MLRNILYGRSVVRETSEPIERRRRVRRSLSAGVALLIALSCGYTGLLVFTPLPELQGQLSIPAEQLVSADAALPQDLVNAHTLPTAVGWLHDDQVWTNDQGSYRIASLTKLITVLVGLERAPVELGSAGSPYTLTSDDETLVDMVIAQNGSTAPAPAGLELNTRHMLELILMPSANNYAISYARWIFGNDEAFLDAAHDWLLRNELESVRIADASGLSDDNVATAADIVRLSRLALTDPLVASIVAQPSSDIPGLGTIANTNRLLSEPGMLGVKTGTTFPNGYSLAAAQRESETDRELVAIAVVLDRADTNARTVDARAALTVMAANVQTVTLVEPGAIVGAVTSWIGEEVPLRAGAGAEAVLVPGEHAKVSTTLGAEPSTAAAGAAVPATSFGVIHLATPEGEQKIPIRAESEILPPDIFWRLTHPGAVLSW